MGGMGVLQGSREQVEPCKNGSCCSGAGTLNLAWFPSSRLGCLYSRPLPKMARVSPGSENLSSQSLSFLICEWTRSSPSLASNKSPKFEYYKPFLSFGLYRACALHWYCPLMVHWMWVLSSYVNRGTFQAAWSLQTFTCLPPVSQKSSPRIGPHWHSSWVLFLTVFPAHFNSFCISFFLLLLLFLNWCIVYKIEAINFSLPLLDKETGNNQFNIDRLYGPRYSGVKSKLEFSFKFAI